MEEVTLATNVIPNAQPKLPSPIALINMDQVKYRLGNLFKGHPELGATSPERQRHCSCCQIVQHHFPRWKTGNTAFNLMTIICLTGIKMNISAIQPVGAVGLIFRDR